MKNITVRNLYKQTENFKDKNIIIEGWVKTLRDSKTFGFIELNDGTFFKNIQIVFNDSLPNFEEIRKLTLSSSIKVSGKFVLTPESKQPFEIQATGIEIESLADNTYPLQKKRHSFEYLRTIAHLRPRTNTFNAVFRVRSVLAYAIHKFFQEQDFVYVHTPILTGSDAEGAGEMFNVNSFDLSNVPKTEDEKVDYSKDFFGRHAHLTVSGQLNGETFAESFCNIYTFGPTFRAENSNTVKHAAEFWMIEPEICFADLEDDMDLAEDMIKYTFKYVLDNCKEEMEFFEKMIDKDCIKRVMEVANSSFKRMTYTEAISELEKVKDTFENKDIYWGMDLQSEHERYICEKVVKGPVFLIDYPKEIKAFYMRVNDDNKTVAACDLLVPYVGELVGGSQREERYDVLESKIKEMGIAQETLQWYLDLRRFGGCKHSGFGLGFDRMLMYLSGVQNIRDVQPYPRTPRNLIF